MLRRQCSANLPMKDVAEELIGNYSRKGIQLGSIEIPNKFSHSGRNAPVVAAAGDRNQKNHGKIITRIILLL